jgi:simple sugar transport system permease protein
MQFLTQIPVDIIQVIQALVLMFVAAPAIVRYIYRLRRPVQPLTLGGLGEEIGLPAGTGEAVL